VCDVNATTAGLAIFAPLLAAAVLGLVADAFDARRTALTVSVVGLLAAGVVGLIAGVTVPVADVFDVFRGGGPFSAVPGVIAMCGAFAVTGGWSSLVDRPNGGTTAALITFGAASAGLMAASNDLITLLLAVETSAVIAYALVSDARTTRSDEAAIKYFIQGSVATGLFVLAMAILVGVFAPTGRYAELAGSMGERLLADPALVGAILMIAALAFKAGLATFHTWAPDAYETAPVPNAAFLASGPKLGALTALSLFVAVVDVGGHSARVLPIVLALSMVSVLVGSLGALAQPQLRRMLAYAGVAQMGYALLAVAMLDATSAVFFVSTYALATTGAFLSAGVFGRARPDWDGSIAGLAGMGRIAPWTSAALSILLISLAGIPPLLGFWGKFQVFATAVYGSISAFQGGGAPLMAWMLAVAVVVALVGSVISLAYYGSVLRALYLLPSPSAEKAESSPDDAADSRESSGQGSATPAAVVILIAAIVVVLGVAPAIWGYAFLLSPFVAR